MILEHAQQQLVVQEHVHARKMKKLYIFFGLVLLMVGQLGRPIEPPVNTPAGFYGLTIGWGISYEDPQIFGVSYHPLPQTVFNPPNDNEQTNLFLEETTSTTIPVNDEYTNMLFKIRSFCSEHNIQCH